MNFVRSTSPMSPREFLLSLERLGMKFGLENMRAICAALDHPERSFRSVIVAGTNGKGSVTAMTSAALQAAGYRSARYTSPHLERLEERYVIGEREVEPSGLDAAAETVQAAVERLVRDGVLASLPTFFECATAIAFELFRRHAVEVAVIEVGLGGRLDATNVISPMAAAITSIDFDHQDLLGTTLASIAREKAGVIKPGIPVVVGALAGEAAAVVEAVCREQGARYVPASARLEAVTTVQNGRTVASFTSRRSGQRLADVPLALRGAHQVHNAAIAMTLLEELDGMGLAIAHDAMRAGLTDAAWPGRLERRVWQGAEVLLDAAHNPSGAHALAAYLREIGWQEITLVMGVMRDKDAAGMLSALVPLAAMLICTTPDTPRALAAEDLAARAAALDRVPAHVLTIPDPAAALRRACEPGARVVAAGSVFLIGPLRGILR
jgi:dihydrofolate synthase/folylpolyglutamate synthase